MRSVLYLALFLVMTSVSFSQGSGVASLLDPQMSSDTALDQNPSVDIAGSTTVVVWEATAGSLTGPGSDTGYGDSGNQNVYFKRSSDLGNTWSSSSIVGGTGSVDDGDDLAPVICTDKKGTWVIAWYSKQSLGGTKGYDREILFSRSIDDGLTWSTIAPIDSSGASLGRDDLAPSLATDGNGTWVACWHSRVGDLTIVASRSSDNGQTWSGPVSITATSAHHINPRVAYLGSNRWMIVACGSANFNLNRNIVAALSTDNGVSFATPFTIENSSTWDMTPTIAAREDEKVIVCWASAPSNAAGPNYKMKWAVSADRGSTFNAPQVFLTLNNLSNINFTCSLTRLLNDNSFMWMFVSHESTQQDGDIYFTKSSDGDTWSAPQYLASQMETDTGSDFVGYFTLSFVPIHNNVFVVWNSQATYLGNGSDGDIFQTTLGIPVTTPMAVQIISPNGGESYPSGEFIPIHWKTELNVAGTAVRFELWSDTEGWLYDLGYGFSPTGERTTPFYFPLLPTNSNYRIRAVGSWNPLQEDWSDGPFTLTGAVARVESPNGGESWNAGANAGIYWKMNPLIGGTAIRAELWNSSAKVANLGTNYQVDAEGIMPITVPDVPTGMDYKVRVISLWDESVQDDSDAPFEIFNFNLTSGSNAVADWEIYQ